MEAIVLVGGFGTRLLPLTKTVPKPLIPLANVPFLERTIQWLCQAGVDHIILSLHYNAEQFINFFSVHSQGVDLSFAVEETPLGTGGAIKNCETYLRGDRCFIINGDIFTDLDLREMMAHHRRSGARATLALHEAEDASRFGVIDFDTQNNRIRSFIEKPPRELAQHRHINAGLYIFERDVFDFFPSGPCSVERDIYPLLLREEVFLLGHRQPMYWSDLGTPTDYLQAHRDILAGHVRLDLPARESTPGVWTDGQLTLGVGALIRPPVLLADGVVLEAGATVGPLAVLGSGVWVGSNALVEDSIIWDDARIGNASIVRGCVLGRQAQVSGVVQHDICEDYGRLESSGTE